MAVHNPSMEHKRVCESWKMDGGPHAHLHKKLFKASSSSSSRKHDIKAGQELSLVNVMDGQKSLKALGEKAIMQNRTRTKSSAACLSAAKDKEHMQSLWLLLQKASAPLWWISVFWLLICLNRNYLSILVRLSDFPCDYCLWKWERRSRKFACHQSLMYSQIMGWLQLRWAARRIALLRVWQLPPWQGLLVFLVIDAFCINAICWWCVPPCRDEWKASGCLCVSLSWKWGI